MPPKSPHGDPTPRAADPLYRPGPYDGQRARLRLRDPDYACPICGGDENRYLVCQHPGCTDGRDPQHPDAVVRREHESRRFLSTLELQQVSGCLTAEDARKRSRHELLVAAAARLEDAPAPKGFTGAHTDLNHPTVPLSYHRQTLLRARVQGAVIAAAVLSIAAAVMTLLH